MASRHTPGLRRRGGVWHVQKHVRGYGALYESTGTNDLAEAERYLAQRLTEIRRVVVYGERPRVTFRMAAEKFVRENGHLRSLERAGYAFDVLLPFIGDRTLEEVHNDTLAPYKDARLAQGVTAGTVNKELSYVSRVLNLAGRVWRHPNGMTYLSTPPLITPAKGPARKPYPLTWEEQTRLFKELPRHLGNMALFKVNTGLRQGELCALRWRWEVKVPELRTSVFVLPEEATKNGDERIVVLNRIARSVLEGERGRHPEFVFSYRGHRVDRLNTHAWRKARSRAGVPQARVHDLRHTFGHRLRAAGVSFEDRQDLLGHRSGRITTHYSAPDVARLLEAVNAICEEREATVLRIVGQNSGKEFGQNSSARVGTLQVVDG